MTRMYGKDADMTLLRRLSLSIGPSGCEDEVREVIKAELAKLPCTYKVDRLGNVIARMTFGQSEERLRLMVSAHMDEVGFMVTEVLEDGYLRVGSLGGMDPSVLAGRKVVFVGEEGPVRGVLCSKAIHHKTQEERKKTEKLEKLYVDIGASDRDEAERLCPVGAFGTFDSEFYTFGKDDRMVKGKALDDRMGCAALIETMRALGADAPDVNLEVCFCFTVREEIGLSGAKVAAHALAPDYALVLESTAVGDIADTPKARRVAEIGDGGAVSLMDRSTMYNRQYVDFLLDTAKKNGILAQVKKYVSGGNDAGHIHKTGTGVCTAALSVPTRYLHSASCVASLDDYVAVRDLSEAIIRSFDDIDICGG